MADDTSRRNLKISLDVDHDLTWQELFDFVDLARQHVADPTEGVAYETDPMDNDFQVRGLSFYVDSLKQLDGGTA